MVRRPFTPKQFSSIAGALVATMVGVVFLTDNKGEQQWQE
jgi:hypothetical protein